MKINIINKYIFRYLALAVVAVVPLLIWASYIHPQTPSSSSNFFIRILWEVLSWNFIIWFSCLVYFLLALLFSAKTRESIFTRLALMKERDEREEIISAKASKFSFISMLAMLLFLFFLSGLTLTLLKHKNPMNHDGKSGSLSIGYQFSFEKDMVKSKPVESDELIKYNGIPLTIEAILLFLIFWQVGSYHYFVRRYQSKELNHD